MLEKFITFATRWVPIQTLDLKEYMKESKSIKYNDIHTAVIKGDGFWYYVIEINSEWHIPLMYTDFPEIGKEVDKENIKIVILEDQSDYAKTTGDKSPNMHRAIIS